VSAHVNLLPVAIQKARRLRRRRRFWIGLCILVAAIQVGAALVANERAHEVRFQKQRAAQARAALAQERKERDEMRAKAQELAREISAAERLREKHLLSRWFGSLSLMMSPRIALTEMRTEPAAPVGAAGLVPNGIRPAAIGPDATAADSARGLRISGAAMDHKDLIELVEQMNGAKVFRSVHLEEARRENLGNREAIGFTLVCEW
jgi:cell division protein FtsB